MARLHLPHLSLSRPAPGRSVGGADPIARLLAWHDRQRQRARLSALDEARLADLGLTRAAALAEAKRHD